MKNLLACGIFALSLLGSAAWSVEVPCVKLNSGFVMPVFGLGTWTQDDKTAEESEYTAIREGYRLIDTASYYGNEQGVGAGVRRSVGEGIITRGEVFITSKIVPGGNRDYDRLKGALPGTGTFGEVGDCALNRHLELLRSRRIRTHSR